MDKISSVLVKSARIVDAESPFHLKKVDILIENGKITKIAEQISQPDVPLFTAENLHVSIGWIDGMAHFCDPGTEHKEDFETATQAALAGGFTGVVLSPLTQPVVDSKGSIEYVKQKANGSALSVFPLATLSVASAGEDITEMFDLAQAGAVGYFDGKKESKTSLLQKALFYTQQFENGVVVNYPANDSLNADAHINESLSSTYTGLKGMPDIAEEIQTQHNLTLVKYTKGRLHFHAVSTAKAVQLIKEAKKQGLNVTADITSHQLAFDDSVVQSFDTRYKVFPPFRSSEDVAALLQGLKEKTIDCIVSDHTPEDIENKKLEFDLASFGIIGLQTSFAVARTQTQHILSVEQLVEKFTTGPRDIYNLERETLGEGFTANLTFFNPDLEWSLGKRDILSKSQNTPFINEKLLGKSLAIYNKGQLVINK